MYGDINEVESVEIIDDDEKALKGDIVSGDRHGLPDLEFKPVPGGRKISEKVDHGPSFRPTVMQSTVIGQRKVIQKRLLKSISKTMKLTKYISK